MEGRLREVFQQAITSKNRTELQKLIRNCPELLENRNNDDVYQILFQGVISNQQLVGSFDIISKFHKASQNNLFLPSSKEILKLDIDLAFSSIRNNQNELEYLIDSILPLINVRYGDPVLIELINENVKVILQNYLDTKPQTMKLDYPILWTTEEYEMIECQLTHLLDLLVKNLPITENWTNFQWDQTIRFIAVGRTDVGKSTLLRELFRGKVPDEKLPKAGDLVPGREDIMSVGCPITRRLTEKEKTILNKISTKGVNSTDKSVQLDEMVGDEIEITVEGYDSGGYGNVNIADQANIRHEDNLFEQILDKISLSRTQNRPIHMVLFCFNNRFTEPEIRLCVQLAALGIPILPVKTKNSVVRNMEIYDAEFEKMRDILKTQNKDCDPPIYNPIGVLAEKINGPNNDGAHVNVPSSGMFTLVKNIGKMFDQHSIKTLQEWYPNPNMTENEMNAFLLKRRLKSYGVVLASAGLATASCGILPPVLDMGAFISVGTGMIVSVNFIYGVTIKLDWKEKFTHYFKAFAPAGVVGIGVTAATTVAGLTGWFLKASLYGYLAGTAISGSIAGVGMVIVGYTLVSTYERMCRENKGIIEYNEELVAKIFKEERQNTSITQAFKDLIISNKPDPAVA